MTQKQWAEEKFQIKLAMGLAKVRLNNLRPDADPWSRQAAARIVALSEAQLREHEARRPPNVTSPSSWP
jgi:hypothetical protein